MRNLLPSGMLSGLQEKEEKMNVITDYICLDLETTGLHPKRDRIIEIGAVKVRKGRVTETFHHLIDPEMKLEERITELTGITDKELEGSPRLEEVLPGLEEFLGEDVLVGHRIEFDYAFLKRAFVNRNRVFEKQGIDTLRLARVLVPDCTSKRLESLCSHFGIELKAHRALEDARATFHLYQRLIGEVKEGETEYLLQPTPLLFKVKKEGPLTKTQGERLHQLTSRYGIELGIEIQSLTKNEASRYLDYIYSNYGR